MKYLNVIRIFLLFKKYDSTLNFCYSLGIRTQNYSIILQFVGLNLKQPQFRSSYLCKEILQFTFNLSRATKLFLTKIHICENLNEGMKKLLTCQRQNHFLLEDF